MSPIPKIVILNTFVVYGKWTFQNATVFAMKIYLLSFLAFPCLHCREKYTRRHPEMRNRIFRGSLTGAELRFDHSFLYFVRGFSQGRLGGTSSDLWVSVCMQLVSLRQVGKVIYNFSIFFFTLFGVCLYWLVCFGVRFQLFGIARRISCLNRLLMKSFL